jgi:anti-anti-sigma factor
MPGSDKEEAVPPAVPFTAQASELGAGRRLLRLRGDLDFVGAEQARQQADVLLASNTVLVVDLAGVELADSSALRFLLLTRREAAARGGVLQLTGVRPWLRDRLRLGGVLELFDIRPELGVALRPATT